MAYRSEVAIKCEEKAYELFKQVFTEKELYIVPDKIYKDGDNYILYWEWIKWYEEYEGVKAIENVMLDLDDRGNEDGGYGYKFMRLGEDDEDVETSSNDWNIELCMIRKIDIPDGLEEVSVAEEREIVGRVEFANGESFEYTDKEKYLNCIREEIEYTATTGFHFKTLSDDPELKKAVDDEVYNLYGEVNPHSVEHYSQNKKAEKN